MNQREKTWLTSPGKLKNKTVLWCGKVSGKEEGVAESAYNVFIKSFSKARSTKDQKWDILV